MKEAKALCTASALLCLLGACEDPLEPVQRIDGLRVLGARAEVEGDPARTWPAPGETLAIRWLVAHPDPELAWGWAFEACVTESPEPGVAACAAEPFARVASDAVQPAEPRFSLTLPADGEAVTPGAELSLHGIVCAGSQARPSARSRGFECEASEADAVRTVLRLRIAETADGDAPENQNPSLADARLELDGELWQAADGVFAEGACSAAGAALPRVSADGARHGLRLRLARDDREPLPDPVPRAPRRETLSLSHFATAGTLARPYSFVEWDDPTAEREIELTWSAPRTEPDDEALLVRFFFVLRDGRGGSDFRSHALCVEP